MKPNQQHRVALSMAEAAVSQQATQGMADAIGAELQSFDGKLRCRKCDTEKLLGRVADRLLSGWPMCCGETMIWHTARQGAAAEESER